MISIISKYIKLTVAALGADVGSAASSNTLRMEESVDVRAAILHHLTETYSVIGFSISCYLHYIQLH